MAGEADILAALGSDDLSIFDKSIIGNSLSRQMGQAIGGINIDTRGMSPTKSATAAFLQGLVSGGLNQYANNDRARQLQAVTEILPSIYSDPTSVTAPEGVDPAAFSNLKASALIKNLQRDSLQKAQEKRVADEARAAVFKELFGNPYKIEQLKSVLGGDTSPPSDTNNVTALDSDVPALTSGKESTTEKRKRLYKDYLRQGMTPTGAAEAARSELSAEMASKKETQDKAAEARAYAQTLSELADRAEQGLDVAGETGPGDTLRGGKLWLEQFISDDAKERVTGRQVLGSIEADIVKLKRSPGAVSDYESRMMLKGSPSTANTREANQTILDNWRALAAANQEHADFLDAYREQNGTTAGAEKLWNTYREKNPIYKAIGEDSGEINTARQSWQEFFSQPKVGAEVAEEKPAPKGASGSWGESTPMVGGTFQGQKIVGVKKVR